MPIKDSLLNYWRPHEHMVAMNSSQARLSHCKIKQNLLGAAAYGVDAHFAIDTLHFLAHATSNVTERRKRRSKQL